MTAVSLRLPDDVVARLERLSERTGRTKSFYMAKAICERLEDLEDVCDAEQTLIELRSGMQKTIPLADAMKAYDVDG